MKLVFQKDISKTENLKILIASTAKTGNTWLKHLLSQIYGLPDVDVPPDWREALNELEKIGPRWIVQQHFYPYPDLIEWCKQNQVVCLTTIRHPGDLLLSAYFHYFNFPAHLVHNNPKDLDINKIPDMNSVLLYLVQEEYFYPLSLSITWLKQNLSHIIRYEDLSTAPIKTLMDLTAKIEKVEQEEVERAIAFCNITLLREIYKSKSKFFRKGSMGDWKTVLSEEILEILRNLEPYPEQFRLLGYTLDKHEETATQSPETSTIFNPFTNLTHFANGVKILPIIIRLYFSIDSSLSVKWLPIDDVSQDDSFFAWLNQPVAEDRENPPSVEKPEILITNLAAFIYHTTTPVVPEAFPDLYNEDRIAYVEWFLKWAPELYDLGEEFLAPVRESFLKWANHPQHDNDDYSGSHELTLTNYLIYLYNRRPDFRANFLDLEGSDRTGYVEWFVRHSDFGEEFRAPVRESFLKWAATPARSEEHPADFSFTNYIIYIYHKRPDLQAAFPDIYGRDRLEFYHWLSVKGRSEYTIEREIMAPLLLSII